MMTLRSITFTMNILMSAHSLDPEPTARSNTKTNAGSSFNEVNHEDYDVENIDDDKSVTGQCERNTIRT